MLLWRVVLARRLLLYVEMDMWEKEYVEFIRSGVDESSRHMAISMVADWSFIVAFVTDTSLLPTLTVAGTCNCKSKEWLENRAFEVEG